VTPPRGADHGGMTTVLDAPMAVRALGATKRYGPGSPP
jgi:hypothetical protein